MADWWNNLDTMMRILWAITASASLVFIIQTVMTFLGADSDSGLDFDADAGAGMAEAGSGMSLLTFRNFINFLLGFGWAAVLLRGSIASNGVLMLVSIITGVVLVALVMLIFKWLGSMQQTGNINVFKSAAGCRGKVYLTIPAARSGSGKVQININNSVREYDAVTDGAELPTGAPVRVKQALDADTLVVEAE